MLKTEVVGSRTYLIYEVTDENEIDNFSFQMISQNKIEGLLGFSTLLKDDIQVLRYDVSSKITLGQYMDGVLRKNNILNILKSILAAMKSVQEYMLFPENLQLGLDEIYVNVSDGICSLMYLPILEKEEVFDLTAFFKGIITNIKYDNSDGNSYITNILTYLNFHQQLDVDEFYTYISDLNETEKISKSVIKTTPEKDVSQVRQERVADVKQAPKVAQSNIQSEVNYPEVPLDYEEEIKKNQEGNVPVSVESIEPQKEKKKGLFGGIKSSKKNNVQEKVVAESKMSSMKKERVASSKPRFAIPNAEKSTPIGFDIPGQKEEPKPNVERVPAASPEKPKGNNVLYLKKNSNLTKAPVSMQRQPDERPVVVPQRAEVPNFGNSTDVDFGSTVYVSVGNEDCETIILGEADAMNMSLNHGHPCIMRVKNKQKMYLDKDVLRIGRASNYVDFYIGDNEHVGRTHADILVHEDGYYIRDNNSSNHTFVNGVEVPSGKLVKLQINDQILLGDEEFVFLQN